MGSLLIGDVAKRTGITPATIRYYESIGLVSPPPRAGAGYRRYPEVVGPRRAVVAARERELGGSPASQSGLKYSCTPNT